MTESRLENGIGTSAPEVEAVLLRMAELAKSLRSDRIFEEATALAQRVAEGRFYVACIGQFKRGKSTLLNALVGDSILPTGVLPITTVPTVVRHGKLRSARIRFQGGSWKDIAPEDLGEYVSEERNPENQKGVVAVEAFCPSPLLEDGMCFVDTPGLGSVFGGNAAATRAFVPHIDAAIIVVGADPPIAGEELNLVEEVGKQVHDLIVVLNKADRTSDSEREIAKSFTARVLETRLVRSTGAIYEVSAQERLEQRGPERDWHKLICMVQKLTREFGRLLVQTAADRGIQRLGDELLAIVVEEKDALRRPIEESEHRIEKLPETISEANRSLNDIAYLFMAEQRRLSDLFLDQRKRFLTDAVPKAHTEFQAALKSIARGFGPRFRREVLQAAQAVAERHVVPWLQIEQVQADVEYRKVEARFLDIGNDFLRKLSESGIRELAWMPNALDSDKGLRVRSRFRFEQLIRVARPASPLRYLADVFLGGIGLSSVIERDAWEFLDYLIEMNSTRVQSDVVARVQESRDQLEVEIRKLLHEVGRIAQQALEHARKAQAEGAPVVAKAIERFDGIEREILSLRPS